MNAPVPNEEINKKDVTMCLKYAWPQYCSHQKRDVEFTASKQRQKKNIREEEQNKNLLAIDDGA